VGLILIHIPLSNQIFELILFTGDIAMIELEYLTDKNGQTKAVVVPINLYFPNGESMSKKIKWMFLKF